MWFLWCACGFSGVCVLVSRGGFVGGVGSKVVVFSLSSSIFSSDFLVAGFLASCTMFVSITVSSFDGASGFILPAST